MTEIHLIRHGQASFGAAHYDALSDHGRAQARWLGAHYAGLGIRPARVIAGTLSRQIDTAAEIRAGFDGAMGAESGTESGAGSGGGSGAESGGGSWPELETHPGLDEYDADLMAANWWGERARPSTDDRKGHFREFVKALAAWQKGEIEGAETWDSFAARILAAIEVAARPPGDADRNPGPVPGPVFVCTSGGVIGEVLRRILDAPPASWIRVHMQVRNAGYSRLIAGRTGLSMASFNETPHLDMRPGAVTYS
jgi:broad specificity phosphatase PhoE